MKILPLAALLSALALLTTPVAADNKINATLTRLGKVCKNRLMETYPQTGMSDLRVNVSESLQESLDSGEMGLKDIKKYGATFNWENTANRKSGACDVNSKGKITRFTSQ